MTKTQAVGLLGVMPTRLRSCGTLPGSHRSTVLASNRSADHADLARSAPGSVHFEVAASKQALEQLLGHPVLSFCYPSGRFNGGVVAAVQAAGYRDATTTAFGYVHHLADSYMWSRLRISGGERLNDFAIALLGAS